MADLEACSLGTSRVAYPCQFPKIVHRKRRRMHDGESKHGYQLGEACGAWAVVAWYV